MQYTVKLNLFALKKDLEKKAGHDMYWTDIAAQSGISRQTWDRLYSGKSDRIELGTLGKLLTFFRGQGLDVTIADLFVITEIGSSRQNLE